VSLVVFTAVEVEMGAMMNRLGWTQNVGRTQATFGTRGDGSLYVPIIQKTQFDGTPVASTTVTIPLAQGVDASDWVSAVLSVRLHSKSAFPSGASVKITAQNIYLDPNEPDVVYAGTTDAATVTIQSENAPFLFTQVVSAPIGPMMRVLMTMTGGGTAGLISYAISVDLIGRTS
jgi:hypothetical protein